MRVLGLTTSTPRGGAAVSIDGRDAGASGYVDLQSHAERIFEAIDGALAEAGIGKGAIDAIACDVGPGSFTGVRVGIASAKGIALALGVPLIGVGSLEVMAEAAFASGVAAPDELVLAALDAKKEELFVALYGRDLVALVPPMLIPRAADAGERLMAEVAPGSMIRRIGEWPGLEAPVLPDARSVARLGALRLAGGASPPEVEAVYVRPPDAKLPTA